MGEFSFIDEDFDDQDDLIDYACNRCEYEFQHPDEDVITCPKCCVQDLVKI